MSFAVYDVERVEVLRGPQGTLFGRNTTAGAVSFLSRKPTELFEASLKAGLGNSESALLDGYVSGPLAPGVAGRLAATWRRQGKGFFYNRLSGEHIGDVDRLGIKASLQWGHRRLRDLLGAGLDGPRTLRERSLGGDRHRRSEPAH